METPTFSPTFYEFFAGIGLVRLGLEPEWRCLWANDIDRKKAKIYAANFGGDVLHVGDIADVRGIEIPGRADLAWASFPCQDLSRAGPRLGMDGPRSRLFREFVRILTELDREGRRPHLVVVENVDGLLRPENLTPVCEALIELGPRPGALMVDAKWFLPQSRPRVFVIAAAPDLADAARETGLAGDGPDLLSPWTPPRLVRSFGALPERIRASWVWWRLPDPPARRPSLVELLELEKVPDDASWLSLERTSCLLGLMSLLHLRRIQDAGRTGRRVVGFLQRRARHGRQHTEIRLDGLAGCLRASKGGSSRLILAVIDGDGVQLRRLSIREAARLMGVPDGFWLPARYTDAYSALGDGVAVPVVRWLSENLLLPLARMCLSRCRIR